MNDRVDSSTVPRRGTHRNGEFGPIGGRSVGAWNGGYGDQSPVGQSKAVLSQSEERDVLSCL